MSLIALSCLAFALVLLCALSVIDLRQGLLPNKLVLPFLLIGLIFHFATTFRYAAPLEIAEGALLGGGLLYFIRFAANRYYGEDSLGLGDVKLLAAAGVWLGPHEVLIAIIAGALAGIVHGLAIAVLGVAKTKAPMNLKTLSLPAGPGFVVGIIIAGIIKFT
jgi:leader peptidase (prepilin peptidase)/N-methyltransferase